MSKTQSTPAVAPTLEERAAKFTNFMNNYVRSNIANFKVQKDDATYGKIILKKVNPATLDAMKAEFNEIKEVLKASNQYAGTIIVNKIEYGIINFEQSKTVINKIGEEVTIEPRIKFAATNSGANGAALDLYFE